MGKPGTPIVCTVATCEVQDFEVNTGTGEVLRAATTYAYDALGRIDSLHWSGVGGGMPERGFRFSYDDAGRWIGQSNTATAGAYVNPWTLTIGYNEDDQVDSLRWNGTTWYEILFDPNDPSYARDAAGRPMKKSTTHGTFLLAYDGLGQLARHAGEWFGYDAGGAGQIQKAYNQGNLTYNSRGQLERRWGTGWSISFTYDSVGNRLTEDDSRTLNTPDALMRYDGANHMVSRRSYFDGGATDNVSTYWYDALGRRVLAADSLTSSFMVGRLGRIKRFYYEAAGPSASQATLAN